MIKAVTFDLDGVFFTAQSFRRFKTKLPKSETEEDKVNWVLYKSPQMLDFKSGKISEENYWEFARKELGITYSNSEIFNLLAESYEIDSQVQDFVRRVRERGLKTCICSNNFETRIRELEKKFNFLSDFDVKIFSYEAEIMKPDVQIFRLLAEKSGVKPSEIVYSDDDQSKLSGALELGIQAFVYEGFDKFSKKVNELIGEGDSLATLM